MKSLQKQSKGHACAIKVALTGEIGTFNAKTISRTPIWVFAESLCCCCLDVLEDGLTCKIRLTNFRTNNVGLTHA